MPMRSVSISLPSLLLRPSGRYRRRSAAGFTIIEMLAVTAIIGALSTLAIPKVQDALEKARIARAIGDIRALQADLDGQDSLPATLSQIGRGGMTDPWGNPYQYYPFPPRRGGPPRGARKDRFLVPINSTYDLYSMGKDGSTAAPLTARAGRDDIIRANDGGFIGLASKF